MNNKLFYQDTFPTKGGGVRGNRRFPGKGFVQGKGRGRRGNHGFPYEGGNGAKHNLISPNDATSYFTINGKSFPKYISK